jgi:hypothetical protein
MQVRFIMTYDVRDGKEQDYFEFLVRELAPGLAKLGLQPMENWFTQYGKQPQITLGSVAPDLDTVKAILSSDGWQQLRKSLEEHVTNYKQRVIRMSPHFPLV